MRSKTERRRVSVVPASRAVALAALMIFAAGATGGCGGKGENSGTGDKGGTNENGEYRGDGEDTAVAERGQGTADSAWAEAPPIDAWEEVAPAPQVLPESGGPLDYVSPEGRFSITWPVGCNKLRSRVSGRNRNLAEFPGDAPCAMEVICRRWGGMEEGAWVVGYFNETTDRGTPPDPPLVLDRVREMLRRYSMVLIDQTPIRRGTLEGIDVFAERSGDEDTAELWLRAILAGPHYYLIGAWKQNGGLFGDLEYERFFQSFRVQGDEDG